jgi:subtilisin family serine protease
VPAIATADAGRFIVKFKDGRGPAGHAAVRAAGGELARDLPQVNAAAFMLPEQALQGIANNPNVEYVEVDAPRYPMAQTVPYGYTMVQADQVTAGASGNRTVCIIDSGLDGSHEDHATGNVTTSPDGGSGNPLVDGCGHGTHVAGTIRALDNTLGVLGVTPDVNVHIVKVFGNDCSWAYSSDLVDAAFACRDDGNANVISMSLGCSGRFCASTTEENAFDQLDSQGILSIAAAGNDGNTQKSYPASYASVVSVAAVDSSKVVADFSQQNDAVEVAAPGVGVLSTVPMGTGRNDSLSVSGTAYEAIGMDGSPNASATGPLVDCGLGTSACPGGGGQVCLISRGDISFADKVLACQAGGGVGAVIYNNASGALNGTLGGVATSIPSVGITQADGQALLASGGTATVTTQTGGNYAFFDGTSMATPHVSAVAALVWSHDTSWTNQQIRDALTATAEDLGAAGRDNAYGYGLVRAKAALDHLTGGGSCTITESPEASCSDGLDNDCDGLFDGDDPDCAPSCEPTESSEVSCNDGLDNDCDGDIDLADLDCQGGSCLVKGAACGSDSDCCSNRCKGKAGAKTCK